MAGYDFHEKIDRVNTASVKWGMTKEVFGSDDLLPMWVADMDFRPPEEVQKALAKRIEHGIYGYTYVPPSVSKAIKSWLYKRHDWQINRSWLLYASGVVPAISTAIQAFTVPGDKVMLQSPVYYPFFEMVEKNDRIVVNSPLQLTGSQYEINFTDFEECLKQGVKLFLLCSPHNPGGRVWNEEELTEIGRLCVKYDCLILSDEIHSDLVFSPYRHIPIASFEPFSSHVITCIAPSKTFNLAGLQAAALIIKNEKLREQFREAQQRQGFFSLNTFGTLAMEAAFRYGEPWLDSLLDYLQENVGITKKYFQEHLPRFRLIEPESTYLLWIDCRPLGLTDEQLQDRLLEKGKLALEPGSKFRQGGEGFVRMNIGCHREVLIEGLERFTKAFA
ncbi:MalY/PatB family protein [Bacillus canaveralius]|uniref:MalY/PatB family protein n=1 Tax=Bacillus canaveralius TaxID=1403243 RepID=UPI000F7A7AC9|nr:MalY/PatB family protein [Bacillus canaveralius]RSK49770.1 pyridoxal phosphate-dependent aminotransferase [Bacillus canaveralius]